MNISGCPIGCDVSQHAGWGIGEWGLRFKCKCICLHWPSSLVAIIATTSLDNQAAGESVRRLALREGHALRKGRLAKD